MIYTSANSHLGDIAWTCQILRRIPGQSCFWVPQEYRWQVTEMLEGQNVFLLDDEPAAGFNTWIACGRFESQGVRYEHNIDLIEYLTRWATAMGREAGQLIPYDRSDLLASFPSILRNVAAPEFDVLVVNAPPMSGQCPDIGTAEEMDGLINDLAAKYKVLCTNPTQAHATSINASLCNIGNLSLRAKLVVGVASGPIWGCLNIWRKCPIYLFLNPIRLDYGPKYPVNHANNVADMRALLQKDGHL